MGLSATYNYCILNNTMDKNYALTTKGIAVYFEDAVAKFFATKYLAAFDVIQDDLIWVISEFNLDFVSDVPFWSEDIKVKVTLSEITKLKIFFDFELSSDEKVFVKGSSCWLLLTATSRKLQKTDVIFDKLGISECFADIKHEKYSMPETNEVIGKTSYQTTFQDIDFNYHVNNKSYLGLAENSLPDKYKNNYKVEKVYVKYCKESFSGDVLNCKVETTQQENEFVCSITNNDDLACIVVMTLVENNNVPKVQDKKLKVRDK